MDFLNLPSPLWVLGTDTGVGKTHVAARIARAWSALGPVEYRKPFQTGVRSASDPEADAPVVAGPGITASAGVLLEAPLSPLAAAELEGRTLDLDELARWAASPPAPGSRLILEAAGGVMVPLAWGRPFAAWATELRIPCVLVARGGLGTLNHVLLSAEALMLRGWTIACVILNPAVDASEAAAPANARILSRFLPVPVHVLDPHEPPARIIP
jgi:dethiobiotin synthase